MHLSGKPDVMVVDDDPAMCMFLETFLAERGCHAITWRDAQDAVKQYQAERPAAVELSADTMRLLVDYDWPGNIRELENLIKRTVVLASETPIRKELTHGIAVASHKVPSTSSSPQSPVGGCQSSVIGRQPLAADRTGSASRALAAVGAQSGWSSGVQPLTPTEIACVAAEAGNYSLKNISRTAAREAERELIFRMLQQTRWKRRETAEILGISYKALLYKIKENGLDKAS